MERNENHWLVLTQYSEQPRKVTFIYPHHLDKDFLACFKVFYSWKEM